MDMTIKDDLPHLVDELAEDAAREALALRQDPRSPRVVGEAPIEHEPKTTEDRAAVTEAREALARGDTVRDDDLEESRS